MNERISALAEHHLALGASMVDWNAMGVPWSYHTDVRDEHDALREAAGLFDLSGMKKIHLRGPASLGVVDHVITRDMTKIPVGKSAYGPILVDDGGICDDAIIFHVEENYHLVVYGSGECEERLNESAEGRDVILEFDDDLHDITLQGPKAADFLNEHTPIDLPAMKFFHHANTTLFDRPVLLSRTGYSGERGYEIFATAADVVPIWEEIVERGKPAGIMPCSFACIGIIRVESALLLYPYDMTKENTPWETTLGWAVSRTKGDFRGKEAVLAREGKEKVMTVGIVAEHDDIVDTGAKLWRDGREVGVVTSPAYSHRMKSSLTLAHVEPAAATEGTTLELKGETVSCAARVARIPFYDPEKSRTHA